METFVGFKNVKYNEDTENHILIKLSGQSVNMDKQRPPITIVGLLDISSSMSSEEKIGYLKKSIIILIDHLTDRDGLALVAYGSNAQIIFEMDFMTAKNKLKAKKAVKNLVAWGSTNMSEALSVANNLLAKAQLEDEYLKGENRVIRTLLFTDGYPTSGNTDKEVLANMCKKICLGQVTTMGYGKEGGKEINHRSGMDGEVDLRLLQEMAQKGKGNYYFMKDPDSCSKAFAYELAGLLTTVGQKVQVMLESIKGIAVIEVLDDYDVEDKSGLPVVKVNDLLAEETKYICFKIKCKKQNIAYLAADICKVAFQYYNIEGHAIYTSKPIEINFVKESEADTEQHIEVKTHLTILKALSHQVKAEEALHKGDYIYAQAAYAAALTDISEAGSIGVRASSVGDRIEKVKDMANDERSYLKNKTMVDNMNWSTKSGKVSDARDVQYATDGMINMSKSFSDSFEKDEDDKEKSSDISKVNAKKLEVLSSYVKRSTMPKF